MEKKKKKINSKNDIHPNNLQAPEAETRSTKSASASATDPRNLDHRSENHPTLERTLKTSPPFIPSCFCFANRVNRSTLDAKRDFLNE